MNIKSVLSICYSSFTTIGYLFIYIFFGLILDSTYFASHFEQSQHFATLALITGFIIVYHRSGSRIREQMLYAVAIGFVGEYLFSIVLGMYTYRLGNVPLYIPFGHAIVYIAVVYFCKKPIIKEHKFFLEKLFSLFVIIYATAFLIFAQDVFGFIMSMLVLFFLRNKPRERLFYLSMYVSVAFLEIIGTNYGCWVWPDTAYGVIPFLKSANPPSGISLFYFLLDLGSLWLYKQRHKVTWARMKHIRALRLK